MERGLDGMGTKYRDLSIKAIKESRLPKESIDRLMDYLFSIPSIVYRNNMDITDYENVLSMIENERKQA